MIKVILSVPIKIGSRLYILASMTKPKTLAAKELALTVFVAEVSHPLTRRMTLASSKQCERDIAPATFPRLAAPITLKGNDNDQQASVSCSVLGNDRLLWRWFPAGNS